LGASLLKQLKALQMGKLSGLLKHVFADRQHTEKNNKEQQNGKHSKAAFATVGGPSPPLLRGFSSSAPFWQPANL
jgi:hypothetical protein